MAIDKSRGYVEIQKLYRVKFLQLEQSLDAQYGQIAIEFRKRLQDILDNYSKANGALKKTALDDLNRDIDQLARWFTLSCSNWLSQNIMQSANLATTSQDAAAMYYIKAAISEYGRTSSLGKLLSQQASAIMRQQYGAGLLKTIRDDVWKRRWADGFSLSDRIWTVDKVMRQNLHDMVEQCVNSGLKATDFSRAVEQYMETPGPKWTTAIRPAKTERGSIRYNALRLARTESNQAYRRAQVLSAGQSALVKGIKWNLSGSHPKEDICDQYATQDLYGLGPGVYPVGKVPEGHPNCLCFLSDVLLDGDQLISALRNKYKAA